MIPEPEYKISKLYVEVTSADPVERGGIFYYLHTHMLKVIIKVLNRHVYTVAVL